MNVVSRLGSTLKKLEYDSRPINAEERSALLQRWNDLPPAEQTPGQLLGRRSTGCEATHGVFPKCNFSCKPCYHSADANKVRIDGPHTTGQVRRQMEYFRSQRGFGQFAQLIGGEVSLLDPEDHAECLQIMRGFGRMPMSFTHGDFDYSYLKKVAVTPDGRARFKHLAFAAHFDTTMVGRRGNKKPRFEVDLDPARQRFCEMFDRLKDEHGITSYLAHNMTVTPNNIDQISDVVQQNRESGWRLFSFQPAAYVGDSKRWSNEFRSISGDSVWAEIETGAGSTLADGQLPFEGLRFGDLRCNRVTWGAYLNGSYTPIIDEADPRDAEVVDHALQTFPGSMVLQDRLSGSIRITRSVLRHPQVLPHAMRWLGRYVSRAGGWKQDWRRVKPVTFVMHQFMDAKTTSAAWTHLQAGSFSDDPEVQQAQERLQACAYSTAHPSSDQLVPACVQHGVLDPEENRELSQLLPIRRRSRS